jgi:hypothetical protein
LRPNYATFHRDRGFHERLPAPGSSKAGVGDHENLIHQLRNPGKESAAEVAEQSRLIGSLLLKLRPYRIRADYNLEGDVEMRDVHDADSLPARILNMTDPK